MMTVTDYLDKTIYDLASAAQDMQDRISDLTPEHAARLRQIATMLSECAFKAAVNQREAA